MVGRRVTLRDFDRVPDLVQVVVGCWVMLGEHDTVRLGDCVSG